jgi:aminopeptidase N
VGHEPLDGEQRVRITVERAHETIAIPLPFEPKLARFDPGAFVLADVTYELGVDTARAVLQGDPSVVARIRAARALAKDGSRSALEGLTAAFEREPFWGVLAQAAAALGATRAPVALALLRQSLGHEHPKVRRAVASALGNFRNAEAATALLPVAHDDVSYFVRSAAFEALGKTRDARAFDVLAAAARERTWNSTVESGAVRGLAELADPRAFDLVVESASLRNDEGLRRTAAGAIARIGQLVDAQRTRAVDALDALVSDPLFLVQVATIVAMETLGDARHLGTLDRIAQSADDERCRRDAQEAAIRVREAQRVPAQVSGLRSDVDRLREEQRKLQEKIESLART